MAESGNHANDNGHGPFRRYSPPSSPDGGIAPGSQSNRLSNGASSSQSATPGSTQARANRSARRRWRQWIQPQSPVSSQGIASTASQHTGPSSRLKPVQPIPQPSPIVMGNPQPSTTFPKADAGSRVQAQSLHPPVQRPAPNQQAPSNRAPSNRAPSNRAPSNKVAPFRQRPVWSTPPDMGAAPTPQTPGNRRPPTRRRPTRNAPRPVLNLVRLLIGGIGLAAIAGTLLSVLNPEQQGTPAPVVSSEDGAPAAETPANPRRSNSITAPLPLAEKLTYLENTLLELDSLAPGLSQATFALDLDTGNYVDINGSAPVSAASTIKLPILVAFLKAVDAGQVTLEQGLVLREDLIVGGSGEMQLDELGTRYTALEVATRMMTQSDNTATQMVIELLGGNQALNQQFQDWGLASTVLRNPLPDLEGTNTTSAQDLVRTLALVEQGELLSLRSRDRLLSIMQRTYSRDLIPDGLGDEEALVFNKTGDIGALLGDVALVDASNGKRYILATLIERPHNDGRASELIRRIAELIHGEMNQPLAPIGGEVAPEPSSVTPEPNSEDVSEEVPSDDLPPDETGTAVPQG